MRIAIIGAPRAGKTTLALQLAHDTRLPVVHTDDLAGLGWSAASAEVVRLLAPPAELIVEGVAVVRALRKALGEAPGVPVERCIVLARPRVWLTRGQLAMARGCATVLKQIERELERRGVSMEYRT